MSIPSVSIEPLSYMGDDLYSQPAFINAMRAPTTQDIYNAGTRWQNNAVSPFVIYQTTGAGIWYIDSGAGGSFTSLTVTGTSTLTGTTNINTSGAGVTTIGTGGTGAVNIGNATGNTAITGTLNAGGNVNLTAVATKISYNGGAATDFIGSGTLTAGTVTIANTNIAATDRILVQRTAANASTTLGMLSYTISAGASFTVNSLIVGTPGSVETGDASSFVYFIVGQT